MDIKAKIEELAKQKAELDANIAQQREASAKLKATIKKLEKTVSETEALLDGIPVVDASNMQMHGEIVGDRL